MQDTIQTSLPAAKLFRRPAKHSPLAGDNWRRMVYSLFWYQAHAKCTYCGQHTPCAIRVAQLTNGWEARDVICRACQVLWPARVGARPRLMSPEEVAAQRHDGTVEPAQDQVFDQIVAKFFPSDGPIAAKLFREDPVEERRRRSQMLFSWADSGQPLESAPVPD